MSVAADLAYDRLEREIERAYEFVVAAQNCGRAGVHMDPEAVREAVIEHFNRCITVAEEGVACRG
jgi:hypothetical protein